MSVTLPDVMLSCTLLAYITIGIVYVQTSLKFIKKPRKKGRRKRAQIKAHLQKKHARSHQRKPAI